MFLLVGEILEVTGSPTYLGVTATSDGVEDSNSLDRIEKARKTVDMPVRVGV